MNNNNNNNDSSGDPFEQVLYRVIMNDMLTSGTSSNTAFNGGMLDLLSNIMHNSNPNLFGSFAVLGNRTLNQLSNLQTENTILKTENEKLKKDNSDLNQKYQTACLSSRSALKIISEKNNVIKKQKETIDRLEQKFNLPSNKSKELTQNSKNSVASGHHRPSSLLEKIKSLKDNLEQCKAVEYSYNSDSKNQQIK